MPRPRPRHHRRPHRLIYAQCRRISACERRPKSVTPRASRRFGQSTATAPSQGLRASGSFPASSSPTLTDQVPRSATLKILRVLIRHGIDIGWLDHDPSLGIKRPKTQEIRSWTDAEIAAFEQRWPIGTKQRLAFALMLYTGQRRSDVSPHDLGRRERGNDSGCAAKDRTQAHDSAAPRPARCSGRSPSATT